MYEVSLIRLYCLRAAYLFLAIGGGMTFLPPLFSHSPTWPLMNSVECSLLATVAILAVVGIRYPLQMLPLIFFELVWKVTWLIAVALPLWRAGLMNSDTAETVVLCSVALVLIPAVPWRYVLSYYFKRPGAPWTNVASPGRAASPAVSHGTGA